MKLTDIIWKPFVLNDIFTITATKSGIDHKKLNGIKGNIPYLTRTDKNNAWDSFIGEQPDYNLNDGNVISVGLDTQTAFYQPIPFYTGQNIQVFYNKSLNKYVALFITPLLRKLMQKFNWGGNGATLGRLRRQKIMLPVNEKGLPDYAFMEEYMKSVEKSFLMQYKDYLVSVHVSDLYKRSVEREVHWEAYSLNEICDIKPGVRLVSRQMADGFRPFIGAADSNNGVTNFVSNINASLDSNLLGVNYNGNGVAIGFYHPYEAIFTDDVKRVKFKHHEGNKYVYLFLKAAILKQKSKYQYGYKFSGERMNRQKITLPSTPNGQPDFDYMVTYMRDMETKLLLQYLQMRLANITEDNLSDSQ